MNKIANRTKILNIILGIYIFGIFLSYVYSDPVITQRHGIAFWDALSSGHVLNYYRYCIDNTDVPAVYSISIYILFAIWNLPCWIYEKISGTNALDSAFWIFYGKTLILGAYALSIIQFEKICKKIEEQFADKEKQLISSRIIVLLYATSMLLVSFSIFSGNYDILELVFILAGINALIEHNERSFILFFAIATSMKFFAIWIFVPVILLKEKKIVNIFIGMMACASITVIEDLIFNTSKILKNDEYAKQFIADKAFETVANAGNISNLGIGPISLCFILYLLLCIYCYLQCIDDHRMYIKKVIYVAFCGWAIFFSTVSFNSYWLVLITPFLSLICMLNKKNGYINCLLETVISMVLLINSQLRQSWVLGSEGGLSSHAILNGFMMKVFRLQLTSVETIGDLLDKFNLSLHFYTYINSMIIIMFIAIVVVNYPGNKIQKLFPKLEEPKCGLNNCYLVRTIIHLIMIFLPTVYYIYQIYIFNF